MCLTLQKLGLKVFDLKKKKVFFKNLGRINDNCKENSATKRRQTLYYMNLKMYTLLTFLILRCILQTMECHSLVSWWYINNGASYNIRLGEL